MAWSICYSAAAEMELNKLKTCEQANKRASRDETILQYIDILQYVLQYNTIWLKGNIDILHFAIYCDILKYIAML